LKVTEENLARAHELIMDAARTPEKQPCAFVCFQCQRDYRGHVPITHIKCFMEMRSVGVENMIEPLRHEDE